MPGRWLTFDCFGTLVDWRHGIGTTGELLFPGYGKQFLDAYGAIEAEVEREKFRAYREVLAETTRRAARQLSRELKPGDAGALASTIPYWRIFDDVGPALIELRKEGWKLALLTNCDRDIIAMTQRRLPVPFDAVVTAEDVSAYKPNRAHFQYFAKSMAPQTWIHVAQSYFHDIKPASDMGIKRVWVNRQREKDDPSLADWVIFGLSELPAAIRRLSEVAR